MDWSSFPISRKHERSATFPAGQSPLAAIGVQTGRLERSGESPESAANLNSGGVESRHAASFGGQIHTKAAPFARSNRALPVMDNAAHSRSSDRPAVHNFPQCASPAQSVSRDLTGGVN